MDEKTEELRDIFLDVSEEETVTESQTEDRGSLTDEGGSVDDRLREVIDQLREKFGFETDLTDEQRCELVQLFYDDADDTAIADELDVAEETVFAGRLELHLLRDGEPAVDEVGPEAELLAELVDHLPESLVDRSTLVGQ